MSSPPRGSPWGLWLSWAALTFAIGWVFFPILGNGFFNFDDYEVIVDNPMIRGLGWVQVQWMCTTLYLSTYQPLGWLYNALVYSGAGLDPGAYHLASLLAHGANAVALSVLLFRILELSSGRSRPAEHRLAAAAAALVWAVHPMRVGAVAWATKLMDLMASLFFLLACLAYLRWRGGRPVVLRPGIALAAVLFLASGLSHWSGITLPLVLLLLDVFPLRRLDPRPTSWLKPPSRGVWLEKWPFLAIALALGLLNAAGKGQVEGIRLLYGLFHPVDASMAVLFHLQKTLAPSGLAVLYALNVPARAAGSFAGATLFLVLALTVGLVFLRRRWPLGLGVWVFWLATLLPTFAGSAEGVIYAQDIYAYIPSMGLALLLAGGLSALLSRAREGKVWAVGTAALTAGLVCWLAASSRAAARSWRSPETLWRQTVAAGPGIWVAHHNLATILVEEGRYDEARGHFEEALVLRPGTDAWEEGIRKALRQMPSTPSGNGSPR